MSSFQEVAFAWPITGYISKMFDSNRSQSYKALNFKGNFAFVKFANVRNDHK